MNNYKETKEEYLERISKRPVPKNPRINLPENLETRIDLPLNDFKAPRRIEKEELFMMEPGEKEWERQIDLGSQGQPGIEKRQEVEKEKEIEKEQEEEKEKEMEKEEKKAEEGEEEEKEGNEVAMMGISATLEEPETFEEAVQGKDKEKWIKAMQEE